MIIHLIMAILSGEIRQTPKKRKQTSREAKNQQKAEKRRKNGEAEKQRSGKAEK